MIDIFNYIAEENDILKLKKECLNYALEMSKIINEQKNTIFQNREIINEFATMLTPFTIGSEFKICKNPKVSIVIPVYNNVTYTKLLLNSIQRNTKNIDYEVIIADDNSVDNTKNLDKIFKNIRLIKNETGHKGFIYNVENAIKEASGEYIFLMNNDMVVLDNYLNELLSVIEKDKQIGIAGSKNLQINGTILEAGVKMEKNGHSVFIKSGEPHYTDDDKEYIECDYCSGCSILFKKEFFVQAGGFDKNYEPAYYEDSDFAFNLKYNFNLKSVCVPKSKIFHFKGKSYTKNEAHKKNYTYFAKKWDKYIN